MAEFCSQTTQNYYFLIETSASSSSILLVESDHRVTKVWEFGKGIHLIEIKVKRDQYVSFMNAHLKGVYDSEAQAHEHITRRVA